MKILITTDLFATDTNGVVTSIKNLRDELLRRGHDVRVLAPSDTRKSRREGDVCYVKSVPFGFIYPDLRVPTSYRNALVRELIDWKPDVIHSQCEFFSYQFAKRISKKTGAPIVHTYHTLYEQYITYVIPCRRLGRRIVRYMSTRRLKQASAVIAPTEKVRAVLTGYGIDRPLRVIPTGICLDQHHQRATEEERRALRERLGIPAEHRVLLNLGRLGTEKNLGELLELFPRAAERDAALTFLIVGDGPAKADLEERAKQLGVSHRVVFTGMVAPSEVQNYYQLGDIFVSASTSETQGLTYIEAAANGLPLLCREDPCLEGVLQPGVNGYTYAAPEEFLAHLERMTQDDALRREMGAQSERVASAFDKRQFGDTIEALYREVI